jgi:hypothetical protein
LFTLVYTTTKTLNPKNPKPLNDRKGNNILSHHVKYLELEPNEKYFFCSSITHPSIMVHQANLLVHLAGAGVTMGPSLV